MKCEISLEDLKHLHWTIRWLGWWLVVAWLLFVVVLFLWIAGASVPGWMR